MFKWLTSSSLMSYWRHASGMKPRFRRDRQRAHKIYGSIVAQVRNAAFYTDLLVPDSVFGRFEMITVHMYLVLERLRNAGERDEDLGQALVEIMFDDMDTVLRETGTGDMGVPRKLKKMASRFYGRLAAYRQAMAGQDSRELARAMHRNIFGDNDNTLQSATAMASYVRRSHAGLAAQTVADIVAEKPAFADILS